MKKLLIFCKVALADADQIARLIEEEEKSEKPDECIICMCIDEKEVEYAEKKIVNMGWVGEKIGSELMSSLVRTFRQEAYARADEIEKKLKSRDFRLRIIIETGKEEDVLKKIQIREEPSKIIWVRPREGWLKKLLRSKKLSFRKWNENLVKIVHPD